MKIKQIDVYRVNIPLTVEYGMPISVQCCGGSEITQAAMMHLAQSTRPAYMH